MKTFENLPIPPQPKVEGGALIVSDWILRNRRYLKRSALSFNDEESFPMLWKKFFNEALPDWVCVEIWGEEPTEQLRERLNRIGAGMYDHET